MKGILIDPTAKTVTEIKGDFNQIRAIYAAIDCDTFDCVYLDHDLVLFVDDNGLLKAGQDFFRYGSYPQPLAGKGLILGMNDAGDSIGVPDDFLGEAQARVDFPALTLDRIDRGADRVDHPILGPNTRRIYSRPVFKSRA
jgi:hypothetical protein